MVMGVPNISLQMGNCQILVQSFLDKALKFCEQLLKHGHAYHASVSFFHKWQFCGSKHQIVTSRK